MNSLEQRVFQTIHTSRMLSLGDRVGVAVSGGADSVALLRLLEKLRERLAITLLVVHFDHGLRGAESEADAQFVDALARAHGVPLILDREDVAAAAKAHKWNLEDAARRLRYAFFERAVAEGRATRIAVAHTADDQAETVLAHILRGTGPPGLAGIYPAVGAVVRPLLDERRETLRKYLSSLGQAWREDTTNLDLRRTRARIRHRLMPLLESDFSPHAVPRLARLAGLAREEERFWTALMEDRVRALVRSDQGRLTVRIRDLLAPLALSTEGFPPEHKRGGEAPAALAALTERLIRRLYEGVRGERGGLTAKHIQQVMHLARVSTGFARLELPNRIVVERTSEELIFWGPGAAGRPSRLRATAGHPGPYRYIVRPPDGGVSTVSVPELGSRFRLKVIDWSGMARETKSRPVALDAGLLGAPLILRNWQPGDAYRPVGRRHALKLKEMFLARHVPRSERRSWPVLESAGCIAWVRGMAPASEFCARDGTRAGIVIEEDRL